MNRNIKKKLDYHYKAFDVSKISPDPLQFLHIYRNEADIETAGFISSVFAYGNVSQIINILERIFRAAGNSPYNFIKNFSSPNDTLKLKGLKHRFYSEIDILNFFKLYNQVLKEYGSLKNLFYEFYNDDDTDIKNALSGFSNFLLELAKKNASGGILSPGLRFMFPLPEQGSACKRMNLFLRWMVRKDELDFGLWYKIPPSKLIIPVDIHVARISRMMGLTVKKNVTWRMAEEITGNLKKFDPLDPVKYDFAICHIGMRKLIF